MTLRLTDEQDHALTLLASAQGTSKHEAVVRAIVAAAARTLADAHVQSTAAPSSPAALSWRRKSAVPGPHSPRQA